MTVLLDEIHPGEILLEEFMRPMGITGRQMASDIDVSPSRISEIVHGTRPISADTALRLGLFFSMDPRFWINLQSEYDPKNDQAQSRGKDRSSDSGLSNGCPLISEIPGFGRLHCHNSQSVPPGENLITPSQQPPRSIFH